MKTFVITVNSAKDVGDYFITVRSYCGRVIYHRLKSEISAVIILKTCEKRLILTVTPLRNALKKITKYLNSDCQDRFCYAVNLQKVFYENEQNFSLKDENYGFDINAELFFRSSYR